jgi:cell fate regulator YaaT (PSP1 superfamily)
MSKRIGIQTERSDGIFVLTTDEEATGVGDRVLVETDQGQEIARVVIDDVAESQLPFPGRVRHVVRRLTASDLDRVAELYRLEEQALSFCRKKVRELDLNMKVSRVRLDLEGSRGTFYFTAPQRVDFRELVRILARQYRIRVEMRQIGVRDEAQLLGGLGPCGNELCCSSFMTDFPPVNVRMAREQGIEPNSNSTTGVCGRLKCCLRYEYGTGEKEDGGSAGAEVNTRGAEGSFALSGPEPVPGADDELS